MMRPTAGRLPHALPDCGKYDMKAIHLALDRVSGIVPQKNETEANAARAEKARGGGAMPVSPRGA